MRILTVVRQVLDAEESVKIGGYAVDLEGRKLEEALRLRESGADVEVIAVAVGPARCQDALRTALAMGADRAIHVLTDARLDVLAVSKVVAQLAHEENAELVLCGGQQADWDSQGLGAAIAERLGWAQSTWTSALTLAGTTLTGKHDADEGSETFTVALPAVVTTQQGLNEPRYPTLPNIMKAKKKEMRQEPLDKFDVVSKVKLVSEEVQVKERLRRMLDGKDAEVAATELISLLRNEARVIA